MGSAVVSGLHNGAWKGIKPTRYNHVHAVFTCVTKQKNNVLWNAQKVLSKTEIVNEQKQKLQNKLFRQCAKHYIKKGILTQL